jgi:hypothetical protein
MAVSEGRVWLILMRSIMAWLTVAPTTQPPLQRKRYPIAYTITPNTLTTYTPSSDRLNANRAARRPFTRLEAYYCYSCSSRSPPCTARTLSPVKPSQATIGPPHQSESTNPVDPQVTIQRSVYSVNSLQSIYSPSQTPPRKARFPAYRPHWLIQTHCGRRGLTQTLSAP